MRKDLYTQALADIEFHRQQTIDRDNKLKAAQAEIAALTAAMKERDAKMNEMNVAQADLIRKLDELAVLNTALQERLEKAGQNVSTLASQKGELATALEDTRRRLEELRKQQAAAESRAAAFQELIRKFEKLADAGKLKVVMRNGRMTIELPNDVLFDSAKSELKPVGRDTLLEVGKVLKGMPERQFQIAGHTDNVKIATPKYASNWELSTARGVTVTKLLIEAGLKPTQLSAAGYGEFSPAEPNDTPEQRAKNRRIEITLVPNLDEFVRPSTASKPAAATTPAVAK